MRVVLTTFSNGDQFIMRQIVDPSQPIEEQPILAVRMFGTSKHPNIDSEMSAYHWHPAYCRLREKLQQQWSDGTSGGYMAPHWASDFQAGYAGELAEDDPDLLQILSCLASQPEAETE